MLSEDSNSTDGIKRSRWRRRVWGTDRGIPTGAVLAETRQSDPPVHYRLGTPKGRLYALAPGLTARSAIEKFAAAQDHRRQPHQTGPAAVKTSQTNPLIYKGQ